MGNTVSGATDKGTIIRNFVNMDPTTLKGHILQTADLLNDMLEAMKFKNEPLPVDDLHRKLAAIMSSGHSNLTYATNQHMSQPYGQLNYDEGRGDEFMQQEQQGWASGGKSKRKHIKSKTSHKSKGKTPSKKVKSRT